MGYRTNTGKKFSHTTIGRLIQDPSAKGIRRANYTTGDGTNIIIKPKNEWIILPCEPIISEALWNECNRILDEQEKKRVPVSRKAVHLLSGLVYCDCGKKMYVYHTAPVYSCRACKRKIEVADIDDIFHQQLKTFFLTDADLAEVENESTKAIAEKEELLENNKYELSRLKKRLTEMVDLRLNGEMIKERFSELYLPLEEQMQQIERQLPEIEAEIDFRKIQLLNTETVLLETKDLYTNWAVLPFETKRTIVELITEQIVVQRDTINIKLSYLPTPNLSRNGGKDEQENCTGCAHPMRRFHSSSWPVAITRRIPGNSNRDLW